MQLLVSRYHIVEWTFRSFPVLESTVLSSHGIVPLLLHVDILEPAAMADDHSWCHIDMVEHILLQDSHFTEGLDQRLGGR